MTNKEKGWFSLDIYVGSLYSIYPQGSNSIPINPKPPNIIFENLFTETQQKYLQLKNILIKKGQCTFHIVNFGIHHNSILVK